MKKRVGRPKKLHANKDAAGVHVLAARWAALDAIDSLPADVPPASSESLQSPDVGVNETYVFLLWNTDCYATWTRLKSTVFLGQPRCDLDFLRYLLHKEDIECRSTALAAPKPESPVPTQSSHRLRLPRTASNQVFSYDECGKTEPGLPDPYSPAPSPSPSLPPDDDGKPEAAEQITVKSEPMDFLEPDSAEPLADDASGKSSPVTPDDSPDDPTEDRPATEVKRKVGRPARKDKPMRKIKLKRRKGRSSTGAGKQQPKKCDECGELYITSYGLHKFSSHKDQVCQQCGVEASQLGVLNHKRQGCATVDPDKQKPDNAKLTCPDCGRRLGKRDFERHAKLGCDEAQKRVICSYCNKDILAARLTEHQTYSCPMVPKKMPCPDCGKVINTQHLPIHKRDFCSAFKGNFKCSQCNRQLAAEDVVKIHAEYGCNSAEARAVMTSGEGFCDECGKIYTGQLSTHKKDSHKDHHCQGCDRMVTVKVMRMHAKQGCSTRSTTSVTCPECGVLVSQGQAFAKHEFACVKNVLCTDCGQLVTGKVKQSHEQNGCHGERTPMKRCEECEKMYRGSFKYHWKTVHELFMCPGCGRHLTCAALSRHKIHGCPQDDPSKVEVLKCQHCHMLFNRRLALQRHLDDKHGATAVWCKYCKKDVENYREHVKLHQTYRCEFAGCGKAFAEQRALDLHAVKHKVEEHVKCQHCDKWLHPKDMRPHTRMAHNSRDKMMPCPICSKVFNWKRLNKHIARHGNRPSSPGSSGLNPGAQPMSAKQRRFAAEAEGNPLLMAFPKL